MFNPLLERGPHFARECTHPLRGCGMSLLLDLVGPRCLNAHSELCHYTIIALKGPGRVTPHPILGWDCGRAGMPTARTQYRYHLSSMVLLAVYVPRLCVVQQHTSAKHHPEQKWVYHLHFCEGSHTVELSLS